MKKIINFFLTAGILAILISGQNFGQIKKLREISESLKNRYAPDSRIALFEIQFEENDEDITATGYTNIAEAYEELKTKLEKEETKVKNEIELLPDSKLGDEIYGVVNLSVANLRTKPGHSAEMATQALLGTPLKVYKKSRGFYLVQTPDKYIAWMDDSGFELKTKKEITEWFDAEKIVFAKDYGFCYKNRDEKGERVSDLVIGDILIKKEEEKDFTLVGFPDGRTGYIKKVDYIPYEKWINQPAPSADDIIKTAFRYVGLPYLWGGTSSKGMDCSGFTKTVFRIHGIELKRDASQQVNTGELVDTEEGLENLKPGDLLFFGSKATEKRGERITHVGIYIGDTEFIHSAGIIKVNSFDKSRENFNQYRLKTFIRAKRMLNSLGKNGVEFIKDNNFYTGEF